MKFRFIIVIISIFYIITASSQAFLQNLPQDKKEYTLYDYRQAFDSYWQEYNVINGYYFDKDGGKQKAAYWKQFNRWYYYMEPRVNVETGAFPNTSANEQFKNWQSANNSQNGNQGIMGGPMYAASWSSVGPNSTSGGYAGTGRLNCVAFHPSDNNTFWVGSPAGGLWKTTNGGTNWTVLTDDNSVLGVSDIGIPSDYATSSTIYIATGDRDGGSMWSLGGGQSNDNNSVGVLKSTDGGSTWSTTGLSYTTSQKKVLSKMLIHPNTTSTIYVAGTDGILKSTDSGVSWTNIYSSETVIDLEFKPGDPTTIYASTEDYWGAVLILVSTNSGSSWTTAATLATTDTRIELAVSSANSAYVYAVVTTRDGGLKGIYKSTNSGASYAQVYDGTASNHNLLGYYTDGSGGISGQGGYDLALEVSPSNINDIYLAGVITHKSTNGGTVWSAVNCWTSSTTYNKNSAPVVHADHHMLKFRPSDGALFEANDGGIYNTTNGGTSWNHLTGDLVIGQLYRLSVSQTVSGDILGGFQDNGTKAKISGTWNDVKGGDGMDCHIDKNNVNNQYGAYVRGQISRTTAKWSGAETDISPSGKSNTGSWLTPYIIDPNNSNTLYAGYNNVYKSTDKGDSWSTISTMNTTDANGRGNLKTIAVAPSNSSVIYTADPNTIWVTTNGGTAWTDISSGLPVASNSITYITVKDSDPNTVWVTFGNYNSDRIYESTNGGTSWTNISAGLPNIPIMCVVQNTLASGDELYVGTDVGIYLKSGATNWTSYNTALPNVVVNDLEIYYDAVTPSNSRIYAGTSGRGVWMSPLNSTGCTEPTTQTSNFASSSITSSSMTISWTRGNGNNVIVLAHESAAVDSDPVSSNSYTDNASFGSGDEIGTGNYVVYNGSGTSVNITNLTSGATMHYAFYEYNTVDNCYLLPAYTATEITTGPPTISTTVASAISSTGASSGGDVSSTNGSVLTHKGVCWSTTSNPTTADSKTDDIASGTGTGSYTSSITGLSASTLYHVRAYATNSSGTSYGSDEEFTTACGVVTIFPYTQNFDSWTNSSPAYSCTADGSVSLEDCWTNVAGDDIDWDIFSGATGSSSTGPTTGNGGSGNYLYTESSSCYSKTGYITSTNFDLTAVTNPQLSFYYHLYGADMGTLSVQISTDGGSNWSSDIWSKSGDQGNSWQQAVISIGAYASSANAIIRFKGYTGTGYSSDMAIDDFKIEAGASCPGPNSLSETNIATNSVDLGWSENGSATNWEIEYGASGFTQGSGTTISVSSNPYGLSGLNTSTTYDWYVRANCGAGDNSTWAGPSTFTTSCGTISAFPYVESFEGSLCWTQTDITNTEGEWAVNTGTSHPSGTSAKTGNKLIYFNSYTSTAGRQTRLESPNLDLSSLNTPMFSFWLYHETGYNTSDDRVQTQVYNGSSWVNVGSSVSRYDGTTGWERYTVDISAYSGTIKVGFLATSEYGNDIHIDDVKFFDAKKNTDGKLTKCSPYFVRNGAAGSLYFYDEYTFSVEISANYDITADWTTGTSFDGYLYLYSPSFDPDNPATNLINSNDNFGSIDFSKIASEALTASTDYVIVATTNNANIIGSNFTISVEGSSIITASATADYNGIPANADHTVAATDGTNRSAAYECDDSNDWTHYYDDNGTINDYSDDIILLSVNKNSNNFGVTTVDVKGASGSSEIVPATAPYVNTFDGWFVFNRYWVLTPTTQPSTDVKVRFYYTDADFTDLNSALAADGRSTVANHSDMSFLKINDLTASGYNPNPANGHSGIPKASAYDADGAWIYAYNATNSSTNRWTRGTMNSDYYAEFVVNHFSGGGGGAAGNANDGSLPIELLEFNAFVNDEVNQIDWSTASETNVDYFIIERKNADDNSITVIGKTNAKGNNNGIMKYSLKDKNPLSKAYYRLMNVDFDGNKDYSGWKYVQRSAETLTLINLYPNPTINSTTVDFVSSSNGIIIIELRDVVGRVVKRIEYMASEGSQKVNIDMRNLTSGTYFLTLDDSRDRIVSILLKE